MKQRPRSSFLRDWFWALLLIVLVTLAYTPVWYAGFVWDDDGILRGNPCIIGPLGLKEIWTTSAADICPLTITTFWIEHALWGLAPLPYHLVNVLLHGACSVLLWRVLRSLRVQGAWLGAALWALHPVQVESVAWITELKNTESGLFFLLSILFFVRFLTAKESSNEQTENRWNYVLCLLFAALAMSSKSSTVILPLVLCLCAWWIEARSQWRNVLRVIPLFVMSVAAGAVSIWTQGLKLASVTDPQWVRPWPQRLAAAGDAFWFYLGKLIWPDPLILIYPRWHIDAVQWVSYLPLVAMITFLAVLWLLQRRSSAFGSRACFFAFAYFTVALLPALGLIDNFVFRFSLVFDHFQYLASIGPVALAGAALARIWDILHSTQARELIQKPTRFHTEICTGRFFFVPLTRIANQLRILASRKPWLRPALCTGLLIFLGIASWRRVCVYKDQETLWSDTVARNPSCWMGHNNLGLALLHSGQIDDAIRHFQKALEVNTHYVEAYNNLGNVLLHTGKSGEAMKQYQMALEINPNDAGDHYNLSVALAQAGQLDEAIAEDQKALGINPNYAEPRINLGNVFLRKGQLRQAIEQYQTAIKINPRLVEARANLGVALAQNGQLEDAITQFEAALRLDPNLGMVRNNLARAKMMVGEK